MGFGDLQDRMFRECLLRLGEPVVLFPPAGPPGGVVVDAVFDTVRARANLGLFVELSNEAPALKFRVADLPNAEPPEQGWQFEARGALWEIVDVEPDGGGGVRCHTFRVGPGSSSPLPPLTAGLAERALDDESDGYA